MYPEIMVSPMRERVKKMQDAADFVRIVLANPTLDPAKLAKLGGIVYPTTWAFWCKLRFGWDERAIGLSLAWVGLLQLTVQMLLTDNSDIIYQIRQAVKAGQLTSVENLRSAEVSYSMLRVDARQGGSGEALARPLLSLARLRLSISWWRTDGERVDQSSGCCRHFVDRAVESQLIRARGTVRAAQFPHELQR